jgi:hypothetical protein
MLWERLKMKTWIVVVMVLITSTAWAELKQQAYIKASNSGENARFGWSLALEGETLVVGAMLERSAATGINGDQSDTSIYDAGAVYVFTRSGESWQQQAYIKASNTDENDNFGYSVDISGNTLVVGAPNERSASTGVNGDQNNNDILYAGAAYVFVREGDQWRQQAYLKASNPDNPDYFGRSVAVHGDTIVVGAPGEASNARGIDGDQMDNSSRKAGAAYVFQRTGESWNQRAYLKASNTDSMDYDYALDEFGFAVDVYENTIVVGAPGEDSAATGVNGDQENESAERSGAAYVFVNYGEHWHQQAYIKASNTDSEDSFGYSVAIDADQLLVGAYFEKGGDTGVHADQSDNSSLAAGAAYVFKRSRDTWVQENYLKASNPDPWDRFGESVSIDGRALVIGAWGESSIATGVNGDQHDDSAHQAGAAYLFRKTGNVWRHDGYIKASNTWLDLFGDSVAVSGKTIVAGASLEGSDADGINGDQSDDSVRGAGAAYVFTDPTLNLPQLINSGTSDAWFDDRTPGQGFLVSVFPDIQQMFVAWFTYDLERPPEGVEAMIGEPGHRWLTAQGPYEGNTASLTIYLTEGGVFDAAEPPASNDGIGDGTMTIEFANCEEGLVTYEIFSPDVSGEIPIQPILADSGPRGL